MNRVRITLAVIAVVSLLAGRTLHQETGVDERAVLRDLAPGAVFSEKTGAPLRYSADSMVAFNTYDVTPLIRGYAGPIKLMLVLGADGRIRGMKIIEHRETKNYVHYLVTPEYLNRFIGKSIFDRFEIDKDVDGISRATVSVEALARTVRDASRSVAASVYGIHVKTEDTASIAGTGWVWYGGLLVFASCSYLLTRRSKKYPGLRDVSLVGAVTIVGFYLSSPFSILHIFNLALFRPSSAVLWYVILITTLASAILAGRFYCGWLCPFGAVSEFIGRLTKTKWALPSRQDERWRKLKYYLLGTVMIVVFLTGRADYGNYESYVTLFSFHGNIFTWALVVVSLVANLRIDRFWCRYLCPVAAFTGVLSRKAKGYPSRQDCTMSNKTDPDMSECIRCNRCYNPRG